MDARESVEAPLNLQINAGNQSEVEPTHEMRSLKETKRHGSSGASSLIGTPESIENDGPFVASAGLQHTRQGSRSPSKPGVSLSRGPQYACSSPHGVKKSKHAKGRRSSQRITNATADAMMDEYHDIQHHLIMQKDQEIRTFKRQLDKKDHVIEQQDQKIREQEAEIDNLDKNLVYLSNIYQEVDKTVKEKDEHLACLENEKASLKGKMSSYQTAEIKNATMKSALEVRIKKLVATVKGLCNDHNSLRDNATFLSTQFDGLDADKQSIQDSVSALQADQATNESKSQQLAADYREHIKTLNNTVTALQQKLAECPKEQDIACRPDNHPQDELTRIMTSQDVLRDAYIHGHNEVCFCIVMIMYICLYRFS